MLTYKITRRLLSIRPNKKAAYFVAKFSRWYKYNQKYSGRSDNLLRTEMFVQEGLDIYELPIIIKKTNDIKSIFEDKRNIDEFLTNVHIDCIEISKVDKAEENSNALSINEDKIDVNAHNTAILFASDLEFLKNLEIEQILKEIKSLTVEENINSLLESVVHTEINSRVALESLKQIIELEKKHRKHKKSPKFISNRHELVIQLIEFIVNSQDSEMILEALSILLKDRFSPSSNVYKDILTDEALMRSTNGEFTIKQLIDITKILCTYRDLKYQEAIDYFWTGFVIKQEDITASHLVPLFKLLVFMNKSRNRMQILLEKKLINNYHKLTAFQMIEILNTFHYDMHSPVVLKCIGNWASIHLTSISKSDLSKFIQSLTNAKYINTNIENAIEKTLTMKSIIGKDHALMEAIAAYCSTIHLRNPRIFNVVVKYFERHASSLSLLSFIEVVCAFGELNYDYHIRRKFWTIFENMLEQKFYDLHIDEILYVFLCCAYVNKYFPQHMKQIFSPDFLNELHSQHDDTIIRLLRDQLYLLDTAMTIECTTYKGPMLFNCYRKDPAFIDPRINRILNKIYSPLIKLAGDKEKLSRHVILNKLCSAGLYTLDALIHKESKCKPALELNLIKEKNENTAVLVLLPHYYCWNSSKLIGQQAMKIRHLRKLGFRVMLLDFQILNALYRHPNKIENYLNRTFKAAHEAL